MTDIPNLTTGQRLARARKNENEKLDALESAALNHADMGSGDSDKTLNALKDAAKAWTNAYHATSRARKHHRERKTK
jgi:uncharacterized protein YbaP (TraB family)